MKPMRALAVLGSLLLAACGSGSIQSPDFTTELVSITARVQSNQAVAASLPKGRTLQLEAIGEFTVPPGTDPDAGLRPITAEADWSSSNETVATVDASGVVTAVAIGAATIKASKDGESSNTVAITVTAPALDSLIITREPDATATALTADNIPRGSKRLYRSVGVYSDGSKLALPSTWTSSVPSVAAPEATPADPTAIKSIAAPTSATLGATTTITATASGLTDPPSASFVATVTGEELLQIQSVDLNPASPIGIGLKTQASAIGLYSDGATAAIANESLVWTSSTPAIATVDANGLVSALTSGSTDIVATLKTGAEAQITDPAKRTNKTTLVVSDSACTAPLRGPTYTASATPSGLCIACTTANEAAVVDADDTNHADLNLTLGLLAGSIKLDVKAAAGQTPTSFAAGSRAGFVVGRPAGTLLAAELLSGLTVTTYLDGQEQESSLTNGNVLQVDLLGLGLVPLGDIPSEQAAVSFQTTQPFDAVSLTYNAGVATALSTLQVYNACGTVRVTAP